MRRPATLTGLRRLIVFTAHRDRVRLALWIVGIGAVTVISAWSLLGVYPDQQAIDSYVRLFGDNPALEAFGGPGYGFDDPNIGVILVNETQLWGMVATALMSVFLVGRHTRVEEESERAELILSNVVGRHAPATASVVVVAAANLAVATGCLIGFVALGYPTAGSVALAASSAAVGWVFTGVTAVSAQLASTGRATLGLASALLVVAFVLRAIGDIGDNGLRWASPIGWTQAVRAFADERWWVLVVSVVVGSGLVLASYCLAARRDLGGGLFAERPGRPAATGRLARPGGLALRLHRGPLIAWPIGLFVTGVAYGSIGNDVDQMLVDNPQLAEFLALVGEGDLTDTYFAVAVTMLSLIASGFVIATGLRPHTEETAGRADALLALPLPRRRWIGDHLVVAVAGGVFTVVAAGTGVGVGYASVGGRAGVVPQLAGAALAQVPAVLVLLGVTLVLVGWAPRWSLAAWGALAFVAIVGFLGEVLRLPAWTRNLSPFEHVPAIPAEHVVWTPLVVLTLVAVVLVLAGLAGLERRDIAAH